MLRSERWKVELFPVDEALSPARPDWVKKARAPASSISAEWIPEMRVGSSMSLPEWVMKPWFTIAFRMGQGERNGCECVRMFAQFHKRGEELYHHLLLELANLGLLIVHLS